MFEFNAFKGLDKPAAPTLSSYQGASGLGNLTTDLASPTVVAQLIADPTTTASIETYLKDTYLSAGALTTPEQQQAAILYSDLNLKTTSADVLVNNIVSVVAAGIPTDATVESLMKDIVPTDVAGDPVKFSAMMNALLDASTAYLALGDSIPAGTSAPAGTNLGDVAQKAAIAYTVQTAVDTIAQAVGAGTTTEDAITQIYYLLYDPTNAALSANVTSQPFANPFTAPPAGLTNILDAAGVTLPS